MRIRKQACFHHHFRTGYKFADWYTAKTGGTKVDTTEWKMEEVKMKEKISVKVIYIPIIIMGLFIIQYVLIGKGYNLYRDDSYPPITLCYYLENFPEIFVQGLIILLIPYEWLYSRISYYLAPRDNNKKVIGLILLNLVIDLSVLLHYVFITSDMLDYKVDYYWPSIALFGWIFVAGQLIKKLEGYKKGWVLFALSLINSGTIYFVTRKFMYTLILFLGVTVAIQIFHISKDKAKGWMMCIPYLLVVAISGFVLRFDQIKSLFGDLDKISAHNPFTTTTGLHTWEEMTYLSYRIFTVVNSYVGTATLVVCLIAFGGIVVFMAIGAKKMVKVSFNRGFLLTELTSVYGIAVVYAVLEEICGIIPAGINITSITLVTVWAIILRCFIVFKVSEPDVIEDDEENAQNRDE